MPSFSRIIGHSAALRRLTTALANGRVPHAVLFGGPRRVGKRAMAEALARVLLGAERLEAHPDFRLVERGRDEKTGKLRKGISVDEVRDLREHLRMTPFMGGMKVALIDEAERLNDEAANALLKTLEEPSGRACLILTAHEPDAVLSTVRSRVSTIPLRRVDDGLLAEGLRARGVTEPVIVRALAVAAGRPGVAIEVAEGEGVVHWLENEERRWRALQAAPLHERFAAANELAPPKADREETVDRLREVIAAWEGFLRKDLRDGSLAAARRLRGLSTLRRELDANVQPRLLLERFLLKLETP